MAMKTGTRFDKIHKRGTIWEADLDKLYSETFEGLQTGTRPVLILSNNGFNRFSPGYNCAVLSCQDKESPVHVYCVLDEPSYIQCEQLATIPRSLLKGYKGTLSADIMDEVETKLLFQLHLKHGSTESDVLLNKFKQMESNVLALVGGLGAQFEDIQCGYPLSTEDKIKFIQNYNNKEFLMEHYGINSLQVLKALYIRFRLELNYERIVY